MTGQIEAKSALTDFLNQIGEEEVTICIDGQPRTVTRAEALARKMYLLALGGVEEVKDADGVMGRVLHKPDYRVAKMIREFTEGKAPMEIVETGPKGRKPGSFNSSVSRRLNDRLGPKRPRVKK
jgi:hypothetical protein